MLNRIHIHGLRMRAAKMFSALRRVQVLRSPEPEIERLDRDGIVLINDFLPTDRFQQVYEEATAACQRAEQQTPLQAGEESSFGNKIEHSWGFDRYDGGTLNRFVAVVGALMPETFSVACDERLIALARGVTGMTFDPQQVWIYQTINGDESKAPDLQKVLHRDTFFDSMKFWYFLEAVEADQGPFVYVPGSHRLSSARLAWEQARAIEASDVARQVDPVVGNDSLVAGSFRIEEAELAALGLPNPTRYRVPANTLIMANTFGFHRRGDAVTGARRLALYGFKRPKVPFALRGR